MESTNLLVILDDKSFKSVAIKFIDYIMFLSRTPLHKKLQSSSKPILVCILRQ
jgi:hypothetical protein